MVAQRKIGFVVIGDVDKVVVETLTHRLTGGRVRAHAVRLGDRIVVRHAYSTALMLLDEKRYDHVIVLLDSDSALRREIDRKRREIEEMLWEHDLGPEEVSVCLAVPEIEAWLLADFVEEPEESRDPKGDLLRWLGQPRLRPERAAELAERLDLARARARAPSFEAFARTIEGLWERFGEAPAA